MELVDILDSTYNVVGKKSKLEAHRLGLIHRTIIAGVMDSKGRFLLVRQASSKQDADKFVFPVGGHVKAGEKIIDALRRETLEEIGFKKFSFTYKGEAFFSRMHDGKQENHYFTYFEIISDDKPTLGYESSSYEYFSFMQIQEMINDAPEDFGEGFFIVIKYFYPKLKIPPKKGL